MTTIPTLSKDELSDLALVRNTLDKSGVLLVPGFLDNSSLNKLVGEFRLVLSHSGNEFIKPIEYSQGVGRKVNREKIDRNVLPETAACFGATWMEKLTREYLRGDIVLNHDIYFVKDVVGSRHHANDLHFDVSRAFKFFVYLNDTTAKNGAFACVPGSHLTAQEIRKKYGAEINFENRNLTRELPFTEKDAVAIEGKAGSLIIFDTDVFHRAGNVSEGERWVMRGHSRLKAELQKYSEMEPVRKKSFFSRIKLMFNGA
ncbi:MAG TPA: phytanoyl-CoA dioxygenase family protein [Bacteroidia bacterium]|jgi:hypothetical protein|nr:phytanoyl-CoA dioxygenase family protein [Bacteroidia bacterium]